MKEIFEYIQSDYFRYYGKKASIWKLCLTAFLAKNHCFTYSFWMRLCKKKNPFYYIAKLKHYRLSRIYGIQISPHSSIGYGLYIGHGVGIIINPNTTIGNNCNISQFLTIGSNKGTPAFIGDNVYIGPSVCIIENVKIGNNVTIGAGAVVVKDIPENATVAGVPAKIISEKAPARYIGNRYNHINS